MSSTPEKVQADQALMSLALEGGRAAVTVRSHRTGQHVKVVIVGRKKKDGGKGFVPRTSKAGRVGINEADVMEVRDPDREYPDNYVGRLYLDTGEWRSGRDADPLRAWTAERIFAFATGAFALDAQADVYLAVECARCGRKLEDPVSIERMVGPECYGKRTGSKNAPHLTTHRNHPHGPREDLAERAVNGDPEPPEFYAEEERRMQEMEAYGDRVQTAREEAWKAVARGMLPEAEVPAVIAEAEEAAQALLSGPPSPPCMGCGRPEDTHVPGECVR